LQLNHFERQVLFLLATPPVYRINNTKTENGKADMNYADIAEPVASKKPKPISLMKRNSTAKVNF
jgi:hypothetical protein